MLQNIKMDGLCIGVFWGNFLFQGNFGFRRGEPTSHKTSFDILLKIQSPEVTYVEFCTQIGLSCTMLHFSTVKLLVVAHFIQVILFIHTSKGWIDQHQLCEVLPVRASIVRYLLTGGGILICSCGYHGKLFMSKMPRSRIGQFSMELFHFLADGIP